MLHVHAGAGAFEDEVTYGLRQFGGVHLAFLLVVEILDRIPFRCSARQIEQLFLWKSADTKRLRRLFG